MKNPLVDKDFLYELNQYKHKEIYARIIALSFDERPLESIEGRVTSGSINIDGNSAVRRTCNLSLIAKDVNINDFYWGVSNKFKLEIGINNEINSDYPNIIWFKQGIFVITSFSSAWSSNNFTLSISGKDKMCLLNGDISGNLPASIDFGIIDTYTKTYDTIEIEDYTKYKANKYYIYDTIKKDYEIASGPYDPEAIYYTQSQILDQESLTIKTIIQEAVHVYGKEQYQNIVVNDLDDYGLELLQYRGNRTLYLIYNEERQVYDQMIINKDYLVFKNKNGTESIKIKDIKEYNNAIANFNENATVVYVETRNDNDEIVRIPCTVTKIDPEVDDTDAIGYRITDLTYAGSLISSIGESLTSILDKIKNMLGAFEYFYDIDGKFIFQAKKIYSQTSWNTLAQINGDAFARDAVEDSPYAYSFENVNLIQSFNNTPAINTIRNDYSIWGTRKSVTGQELPIHARYAIHEKPVYYKTFLREAGKDSNYNTIMKQFVYTTDLSLVDQNDRNNALQVDWREIIYQMSVDYFKHNQEDDFLYNVYLNNFKPGTSNSYYPGGETGYEIFYTDMQGFWRQLYNINPEIIYDSEGGEYLEETFYEVLFSEETNSEPESQEDSEETEEESSEEKIIITEENFDEYKKFLFKIKEKDEDEEDDSKRIFVSCKNDTFTKSTQYYTNDIKYASTELFRMGYYWVDFIQLETFSCDFYLKEEDYINSLNINLTDSKKAELIEKNKDNFSDTKYYWNKNVVYAPDLLNFWIDFYSGDDSLQQYRINAIGDRPKVVNNSKVTSVYYREVPQIIFISLDDYDSSRMKTGYTYINLTNDMKDLFSISSRGKSAEEEANELFNQYSYCTETVSITTIPIYHLEPNTLIHIKNDENLLNGKYQITRLTIPLSYNGMMSISATKIVDAVY